MKRDDTLDMLRGIGLLCIMLAHVGPPAYLFHFRNFDVPLMVLVAGSSFAMSTANGLKTGYIEYIIKRLIRLVIPTWTFLIVFAVYLIYEFMVCRISVPNEIFIKMILDKIVYMVIPYGCIFFLGTRILVLSSRQIFGLTMASLLVCTLYALVINQTAGGIAPVQNYKYPPTAYYISYGLSAALLLFWISRNRLFDLVPFKKNLAFFGRSSLWIYLWHIQILYLFRWMGISIHFAVKYIIVSGVSAGIVLIQRAALNQVLIFIKSQKAKKLLTSVFTG